MKAHFFVLAFKRFSLFIYNRFCRNLFGYFMSKKLEAKAQSLMRFQSKFYPKYLFLQVILVRPSKW
jgi:hypothetical protein